MIDGRNRSGAQFDQYEPHALLSKMVQHFFGVTNDQMKSGGRVVGMAANEILGTKYLATVVLSARVRVPFTSRVRIRLPPNLFEFGKDVLNSFPKMSASLG
jgi:hypothetical protein